MTERRDMEVGDRMNRSAAAEAGRRVSGRGRSVNIGRGRWARMGGPAGAAWGFGRVAGWLCWALLAGAAGAGEDGRDLPSWDGPTLAAQVRNMVPEATEVQGTLIIRPDAGKRVRLPIRFETIVGEATWRTVYEVRTNGLPWERLTVLHRLGGANEYWWHRPGEAAGREGLGERVTSEQAMAAFAGSDFWLADLGLEFLHWPEQRRLKEEDGMRKSRFCRVLESVNPDPRAGGYHRVVSYIDHEYGGVILARAYDAGRQLVKSFEVDGVAKVEGQWQLKAIEMRDVRRDSLTRIEFDYRAKGQGSGER